MLGSDELIGRSFGEGASLIIQRKLGEGGMGAVYQAWDQRNERPVAIKFLRSEGFSDREAISRFKREGRKFGQLRHPNIVRVYALGREQGMIYIASEFVDGRNLFEILSEDGPYPVEAGLRICRDVCSGLAEAHRHKVVHRDLKPENVMITKEDKIVKVLDFGIAKDLDASIVLTRQGTYIGTPAYSAPEQIKGEHLDHRADIFSVGVILYELLTGQVAFKGRHTVEVLRATLKHEPVAINKLNENVTTPVARLIERMIKKEPRQRPSDMEEVIDSIDRVLGNLEGNFSEEEKRGIRGLLRRIFESGRS